jgi:hypothetical protein
MVTLGNFEPKTSSTIPKSTLNSAKNSSLFVAALNGSLHRRDDHAGKQKCSAQPFEGYALH